MTTLQYGRGLFIDDLAALPDDGLRHELIDGVLVTSPAPRIGHQRMALLLWRLLEDAAPQSMRVMAAPTDVELDDRTMV